ncbi:abscission/NoCut checkpoint regulator-like [Glandiceps talaboti]
MTMSSHCFICATKFGFLKKEYGCANCGHSVCKKCCSKQAVVPKLGPDLQNVCKKCYNILTNPDSAAQNRENLARYSPPANFKKRLEVQAAKEAEDKREGHVPKSDHHRKYKGLSAKDRDIAERLEKLKEDRNRETEKVPSTQEMEIRLAKLKDMDPEVVKQPPQPVHQPPDKRTFTEQIDDIFTEIADEVALDAKVYGQQQQDIDNSLQLDTCTTQSVDPSTVKKTTPNVGEAATQAQSDGDSSGSRKITEADIRQLIEQTKQEIKLEEGQKTIEEEVEDRLARLRGDSAVDGGKSETGETKGAVAASSVDDDIISEEEAQRRLIKSILAEEALDDKVRDQGYGNLLEKAIKRANSIQQEDLPVDPDELPWCSICNEDAVLRCRGCEGDLFCKRCFSMGHDKYDQHDHKTTPYPLQM